ncbi:MAG: DUF5694 domain-containing protein [Anaerolineales bacterium]
MKTNSETKSKVMLMGVFHFGNPGQDLVKTNQINVMTSENQQYLEKLSHRISQFMPTVVMLEFDPANGKVIQEQYDQYLKDSFSLPSNEIYQIGFRVAKKSRLTTVHSFDEQTIEWNAQPLFDYMDTHDPVTKSKFEALIEQIAKETEQAHATMSLSELLLDANKTEKDTFNKYLYLCTNLVGAGNNFEGADAAASWWHRNFRMYARIQQCAAPGEKVLVIGGQGHMAILKDLLKFDLDREAVDIIQYLQA